ncbi:unnamed protein product [Penicillium viridicatum]
MATTYSPHANLQPSHKRRPFDEYAAPQGDDRSFFLATCGTLELWTADPVVASEVLHRTGDSNIPTITGLLFAQFGHNVFTTNGARWAKQRKVVASVINERISKTVFDATVCQTTGILDELLLVGSEKKKSFVESNELFDMIRWVTIHVLSEAGMGAKALWRSEDDEKPEPRFETTYIEASKVVMDAITGPIAIPTSILLNWPSWLPGHQNLKQLGISKREFSMHIKSLLDKERQSEQGNTDNSLSEEELNGNLFLFTEAGFETTANIISYAIMLLVRYPRWQEWLFEEVNNLMPTDVREDLEYTSVLPRATRIMAVMFETLRLYPPIIRMLRTNDTPQRVEDIQGHDSSPSQLCRDY